MKVEMGHSTIDKLQSVTICLQRTFEIRHTLPYSQASGFHLITIKKHQAHQPVLSLQAVDIDDDLIAGLAIDHGQSRFYSLPLKICLRIPLLQYGSRRHEMVQEFYIVLFMIYDLRTIEICI